MNQQLTLDDIRERVEELILLLRESDCEGEACQLQEHIEAFSSRLDMRRAVSDIRLQLEKWRDSPNLIPDSVRIRITAQQVEDACRLVLGLGDGVGLKETIALRPATILERLLRLALIVSATTIVGSSFFLIPVALNELGVDWINYEFQHETKKIEMTQGEETKILVRIIKKTPSMKANYRAEIYPNNRCIDLTYRDYLSLKQWECSESKRKLISSDTPVYKMTQNGEYYGLVFAVSKAWLESDVGQAEVHLFASEKTPPGLYKIPLAATYYGYKKLSCWHLGLFGNCGKVVEDQNGEEKNLDVPTVVVFVTNTETPIDDVKTSVERITIGQKATQKREEDSKLQKKREILKQNVETAKSDIRTVTRLIRARKWDDAHNKLEKLTDLYDDIRESADKILEVDSYQIDIEDLRTQLEEQKDHLDKFEKIVFGSIFDAQDESSLSLEENTINFRSVAKRYKISTAYARDIFKQRRADAFLRLEKKNREKLAEQHAAFSAFEKRCGKEPKNLEYIIDTYIRQLLKQSYISTSACTPVQLYENGCWYTLCDVYKKDKTNRQLVQRWRFLLKDQRVYRHQVIP